MIFVQSTLYYEAENLKISLETREKAVLEYYQKLCLYE